MDKVKINIMTFQEAMQKATVKNKKPILILGNGFSMAFQKDIFGYDSLLERAKTQGIFKEASSSVLKLFQMTGTSDFEYILQILKHLSLAVPLYCNESKLLQIIQQDIDCLKQALVESITKNHPDDPSAITDQQYESCFKFINNFKSIYSFNYDLLLYWVVLKYLGRVQFKDGFYDPHAGEDASNYFLENYVSWQLGGSSETNLYYPHGALHLYDAGYEVRKYCWSRTGIKLKDQILDAFNKNMLPLYVAEGNAKSKLEKINHSAYLSKCLRSLSNCSGALFIFGLGLKDNDSHIMEAIIDSTISDVYVSLYGDPRSKENKQLIQSAYVLSAKRGQLVKDKKKRTNLDVYFYDAKSASVWE